MNALFSLVKFNGLAKKNGMSAVADIMDATDAEIKDFAVLDNVETVNIEQTRAYDDLAKTITLPTETTGSTKIGQFLDPYTDLYTRIAITGTFVKDSHLFFPSHFDKLRQLQRVFGDEVAPFALELGRDVPIKWQFVKNSSDVLFEPTRIYVVVSRISPEIPAGQNIAKYQLECLWARNRKAG